METLLTPRKAAEQPPHFSAYISCGQTPGQIRTPLGTEVGFSPGDTVLDGDPAPAERGAAAPPTFLANVYCGQTAGWIRIPLGTEVGLGPGNIVLDGEQAPPPTEMGKAAPTLWPMSIVAKRLDGSGYNLVRRWASAQAALS